MPSDAIAAPMSSVATQVQEAVFCEAGTLATTRTIEDGRWVVGVTHGTPVEFDGAGHFLTARARTTVLAEPGVRHVSVNFRGGAVVAVHAPSSTNVSRSPVDGSVLPRCTGVGESDGASVGEGVGAGVGATVGAGVSEVVGLALATTDGAGEAGTGVAEGPAVGPGLTLALAQAARAMVRTIASGPARRRGRGPIHLFFIVRLASSHTGRQA